MRLRNVNIQVRNYLEDLTEEKVSDGYLSTRVTGLIASQLSDEMKEFSHRMKERKDKDRIHDLATTSSL